MELSEKATRELERILCQQLDAKTFQTFTPEMINELGIRLLQLAAISLKREIREQN